MPDVNLNVADARSAPRDAQDEGHVSHEQPAHSQFEVGSYVTFGRYPQNNGDTPEPIEWLVLDNDGKTALLLSKFGLDCRPFHHEEASLSWRDCDLRQWLNRDFLNLAFTAEEQGEIIESQVYTDDNPYYGGRDCGFTHDKVFCPSIEEIYKYFGNVNEENAFAESRYSVITGLEIWVSRDPACQPSAYAVSRGASQGKFFHKDEIKGKQDEWWFNNCCYWLRSPGHCNEFAAGVQTCGRVNHYGQSLDSGDCAVRPALRIKLSRLLGDVAEKRDVSCGRETYRVREAAGERAWAYSQKYELPPLSLLNDDKASANRCEDVKPESLLAGPGGSAGIAALKDILASDSFKYGLGMRICLGKDIKGCAISADLASMPQLIMANSASWEKSVCMNAIILSLLYKFSPDCLQFLLIGSEHSELSIYNGIPHLIGNASEEAGQVITDSHKADVALRGAVELIFSRYKLLSASNAHNIDEYNARKQDILPWVIIIIDEMDKLMAAAPESVEKNIGIIAQNGRVAGIHIVTSTRASLITVVRNLLKKKNSSRLAFVVSSQADSRVKRDDNGTERLLGKGAMLFKSVHYEPEGTWLVHNERIQGAYATNEEIGRVVAFWRGQGKPANIIELKITEPMPDPFDPAKDEIAPAYALSAQARFERGSYVTFGRYPQNNGNTPEPIEWLVLDNDGETALLISKYGLDGREFHNVFPDAAGWSSCSLREWLNIDFLRKAFNDDERQRIVESILHNDDTVFEDWNGIIKVTKGCGDTRDRIFFLSIDEAEHYFADNVSRMCAATRYAKKRAEKSARARLKQKKGMITEPSLSAFAANSNGYNLRVDIDSCCYWLRSPGDCEDSIARVYYDGSIHVAGSDIYEDTEAVRPALRIKL